jgi:peptidoglycan/LPS O-acetylase OafA/YrhL
MLASLLRPVTAAKQSFYSIDLVRGLSAIAILIFHYFHFLNGGGSLSLPPSVLQEIPTLNRLAWLRDNGSIAVMLFWMISGFVFMNVYAGLKPGWKTFFVNRFARLYPLHLTTLLIVALIQLTAMQLFGHYLIYKVNDLYHFGLQLFMASEWFGADDHSFNGPIWSVSVEILIYIVFYLYVRFLPVNLLTQGLFLGLFAGCMLLMPSSNIPVCGAFFFGGMLTYSAFFFCPDRYRPLACIAGIVTLAAVLSVYFLWGRHSPLPMTAWLLAIFGPLLLTLALSETLGLHRWYRHAHPIGDITYSTYLWHSPLQMMFLLGAGLGAWPLALVRTDAFVISYVAVSCIIAWFSFRYLERPAQNWIRSRLLHRNRPMPLISAP